MVEQSENKFTKSKKESSFRYALNLSYFTVAYNFIEGFLSILAGLLSGSIALVGFGLDSFIESLSGSVMIWRFYESRHFSDEEHERREKIAIKLVSYSFFVFGAYVLYESVKKLYFVEAPEPSIFGIIIALVSIIVMPILYHQKQKVGKSLTSSSLLADSKQTLACVFLSAGLLISLLLNYLFGIWWADPIVGLIIVLFLFKEGYNTYKEETLCC
ncbi:MAG: cation diffusion facilitator family transporter [Candidatus Dadabacteria bacterium]|nr:cation diffusion facilitator family transporter [Candidatus Dadabacteria bacterium]